MLCPNVNTNFQHKATNMKARNPILIIIFAAIVLVELLGRMFDFINLEYFAKPLIMIWIAVFFLLNAEKKSFRIPVLIAFLFSWMGDMLLMFSGSSDNEMFFYAGVGGFFLAQCMYIYIFIRYAETKTKGFLIRTPLWFIPFVAYLAGIYILLFPSIEGMMKPIILVYAISLVGMSLAALNRKGRVGMESFRWIFLGSVFFVISDSILAFNKFYFEDGFAYAGFWIMLTYITAQYYIMRGLILEKKS